VAKARPESRAVDGILLLDKPAGISSSAAVQQVKRLFNAAKAGHAGSLDPLATGMLPVCLGEATKLCAYLLDSDKRYTVRARVGTRTTTGDAEGQPVAASNPAELTREALAAALPRFVGETLQRAPMYSARKHEGRRLYELAREGVQVEREARPIRIHELRLTAFDAGTFDLDVRCSKGTYIRTLVEDLAAAVGQQSHVEVLRREEVSPFGAGPMVGFPALEDSLPEARDALLLPGLRALAGWPTVTVDAAGRARLAMGQAVRSAADAPPGDTAVLDQSGRLLAIAELRAGGWLAPRRWLAGQGEKPPDPPHR
jgi:tRNA pseudouridine55 synthase